MKRNSVFNSIMLLLLAVCVLVPLALTNTSSQLFLDSDNRYAQEWPTKDEVKDEVKDEASAVVVTTLDEDVSTTEQIENYFNDRIGLRSDAMTAYAFANDKAFHILSHPLYEYGMNGQAYFWFDNEQPNEEYLTAYANYISQMYEYCKSKGVSFVYVNSPEKKQVYSEDVPNYVPCPVDNFAYVAPLLNERGVPYIDLTLPLIQAHDEGIAVYNDVYDVGHWNVEGALVGAQTIVSYLQNAGYDVEQPDIAIDYDVVPEHHDFLPASLVYYPIDTYKYIHKSNGSEAKDVTANYEPLDLYSNYSTYTLWENESCDNNLNVLMFQGSYFNTQGTILYNQFTHMECIHAYMNIFNFDTYFEMFNPDIVIFESANYAMQDAYYSYERLTTTELL